MIEPGIGKVAGSRWSLQQVMAGKHVRHWFSRTSEYQHGRNPIQDTSAETVLVGITPRGYMWYTAYYEEGEKK